MAEKINAAFLYDGKDAPDILVKMFEKWPWGKQLINVDKLVVNLERIIDWYGVVFKSCDALISGIEVNFVKPDSKRPPKRYFQLLEGGME